MAIWVKSCRLILQAQFLPFSNILFFNTKCYLAQILPENFQSNALAAMRFIVTKLFDQIGGWDLLVNQRFNSQLINRHIRSFAMRKAILLALAISASLFSSSTFAFFECVKVGETKYLHLPIYDCSGSSEPSPNPGTPTAVPEIDGAGAGIAFALVGGLVLAYRERRLSKKSK